MTSNHDSQREKRSLNEDDINLELENAEIYDRTMLNALDYGLEVESNIINALKWEEEIAFELKLYLTAPCIP
ncbi:MAG: hypothetical protein U0X74_02765 [Anaerolineales bacterium]